MIAIAPTRSIVTCRTRPSGDTPANVRRGSTLELAIKQCLSQRAHLGGAQLDIRGRQLDPPLGGAVVVLAPAHSQRHATHAGRRPPLTAAAA